MKTYDTINWEAEAKRIAEAFGVDGDCEFIIDGYGWNRVFQEFDNNLAHPKTKDGSTIVIYYDGDCRDFSLFPRINHESITISINWFGELAYIANTCIEVSLPLARGLYRLDLLTPEVETALQVTITAHQKLEWMLERESQKETK